MLGIALGAQRRHLPNAPLLLRIPVSSLAVLAPVACVQPAVYARPARHHQQVIIVEVVEVHRRLRHGSQRAMGGRSAGDNVRRPEQDAY